MEFRLLDYSSVHFGTGKKGPLPVKRKGKFVQIRDGDVEYMVLSPAGLSAYHANIVERFCLGEQIEGVYRTGKMDDFKVHDAGWDIVGGGYWQIDDAEKRLSLSGSSQVYGRFDSAGLAKRILSHDEMAGYDVHIR